MILCQSDFLLLWLKDVIPPFLFSIFFVQTRLNLAQLGSTPLNSAQFCSLRSTFKKDSFASIAFTFFKKMQLYHLIILLLVILLPVICPVIWCFPIWLTSSLSYPMAIFSANEIQTFLLQFIRNHKIKTLHSYMKTLYFYSVSET